jgi:hypothetical protein
MHRSSVLKPAFWDDLPGQDADTSAELDPVTFASSVLPVIVSDILPAAR